jgi:hypothetical protein
MRLQKVKIAGAEDRGQKTDDRRIKKNISTSQQLD